MTNKERAQLALEEALTQALIGNALLSYSIMADALAKIAGVKQHPLAKKIADRIKGGTNA